ncbi:MAG: hypothetical protein ABFR63_09345 [Thermodesulfobacteriota bacterium]
MPHAFSVEIHEYLSKEILVAEEGRQQAIDDKNSALQLYCEGQLLELAVMRDYLTKNIDLITQKYY